MHYPVEFHFGPARIPAHLVFEMLSYTLGYRLYAWQRARYRDPISDDNRWWIFIGAAAGAFFGSHLLGMLENPSLLPHIDFRYWMSTKTVVGGFLGGLAGVEITKKIIGVGVSSGDLMTYPLILGLAIGRVGCHLAGLEDGTHGLPSGLPWAIDFGDGTPRHPVNLYEIVFLGLLALCIFRLEKGNRLADGARFKIFMITYLLWRFFAEWLKPVHFLPFGPTSIQLACVAGLFYYRKYLLDPRHFFTRQQ